MMGSTHAVSGLAAGLALAPVVGLDTLTDAALFATVVAGYALLPDLDCHGATASRLLGPVTGLGSRALSWCSVRLYQATRGPAEEGSRSHGGHRHATHCLAFVLLAGGAAAGTSLISPWVVAGWLAFGVLAAAAALGAWILPAAGITAAVALLADGGDPLAVLAGMQGWCGLAVAAGTVTHLIGDGCTVSGVPFFAPFLSIRGETWAELNLLPPRLRLHTGTRAEHLLVLPACAVLAALAAWPLAAESLPDLLGRLPPALR